MPSASVKPQHRCSKGPIGVIALKKSWQPKWRFYLQGRIGGLLYGSCCTGRHSSRWRALLHCSPWWPAPGTGCPAWSAPCGPPRTGCGTGSELSSTVSRLMPSPESSRRVSWRQILCTGGLVQDLGGLAGLLIGMRNVQRTAVTGVHPKGPDHTGRRQRDTACVVDLSPGGGDGAIQQLLGRPHTGGTSPRS